MQENRPLITQKFTVDLSQTAGISVEAFQELSYVGLQFGIDTEKNGGVA